jgi:hypothetical protein
MSAHLHDAQLSGYIHHTLTDAQREVMDQHLATCPHCRARLAGHEALQKRIRHELLADLRAINPPPRMTLAAIRPRPRRSRALAVLRRCCRQLFPGVAALATVAVQAIILLALFGSISQPVAGATLVSGGPAAGEPPEHWSVEGVYLQQYEVAVDHKVAHSGEASATLRSIVSQPQALWGHCSLMQRFRADAYRGQRLRMSAYVRMEDVEGQANLWVRTVGPERQVLNLDDIHNCPLRGTMDWHPVEIVTYVPEDSVLIEFGVDLAGKGQVWVDDFRFEQEVPR